ncbi:hypothetical protein SeMB42_g02744 [Synchytrium endobioticum]|uniref:Uncharacterized protein n=1 Tax=Synchytrium endobioticum TaxID=286115 RepID=A0A507DCH7_9FUNG|nr:hypothetical protein SeMB42_g02744 [Synchytrium endobioticum]
MSATVDKISGLHVCRLNCGNKQCVNVEQLQRIRIPRKKDFDADAAWEGLLGHGVWMHRQRAEGRELAGPPVTAIKWR